MGAPRIRRKKKHIESTTQREERSRRRGILSRARDFIATLPAGLSSLSPLYSPSSFLSITDTYVAVTRD